VTTTAAPTPWPTSDQVITALGTMQDRDDLHPKWRSVLGRLRQDAERHTALRAAGELLERERQTLAGETDAGRPRPSGALAVFDAAAKVGELETMALCRYARCACPTPWTARPASTCCTWRCGSSPRWRPPPRSGRTPSAATITATSSRTAAAVARTSPST
jgi:hypothetical protein